MADIAQQHFLLTQDLPSVLLCAVVIIVMNNGAASVMAQCRGRHRWTFQIAANVVDVLSRMLGLFAKWIFQRRWNWTSGTGTILDSHEYAHSQLRTSLTRHKFPAIV